MKKHWIDINSDFKCQHCQHYVSSAALLAGVQNRNHCPYCLWSRHLDLCKAGDRLAACKAPMRPVGLTLKHSRNKYAEIANGELMLVHLCTDCSRVSINRIAADDVPEMIMEVFEASMSIPDGLRNRIRSNGIHLLDEGCLAIVCWQIYGQAHKSVLAGV